MRSVLFFLPALLGAALRPAAAQQRVTVAPSQPQEFQIEASHSTVGFSIGFVGLPVRGTFDDIEGTIVYVSGRPEASAVTVAIGTASVHTGSEHRDGHLKSSDFFDAVKYPTILFQSTGIEKRGERTIMRGNLRMHGVTREISFPFTEAKGSPVAEPHGATLVQFSGALRLARKDFGIIGGSTFNDWFDTIRQASMADSVDINLEVTAWDPDYSRNHRYDAALARIEKEGVATNVARLRRMNSTAPDSLRNAEWELSQVGHALIQRGDYADAVQILLVTTEIFPKSAQAQSALARAYELQGDRQQAVARTRAALSLRPDLPRALELRRRLGA